MRSSDGKSRPGAEVASGPGAEAMPRLVDRLHALGRTEGEITVGDLVDAFGAQGHAPLLLIVSLLMILPVGMIPGVGGALGLLAAAIGVQMFAGSKGICLPDFMRRRNMSAKQVGRVAERVRPASLFLARHLEARMEWLATGRASLSVIAGLLIVAGGSIVIVGAIPVLVPLVGLPIAIFAIGIMARDGAVVAAGYVLLSAIVGGVLAVR